MFFSNSSRTGTTRDLTAPNPADNYAGPNVSQYGWTTYEIQQASQLAEYVNIALKCSGEAKKNADYVEGMVTYIDQTLVEVLEFRDLFLEYKGSIEDTYNESLKLYNKIVTIRGEVLNAETSVNNSAGAVEVAKNAANTAAQIATEASGSAHTSAFNASSSAEMAKVSEDQAKIYRDESEVFYDALKEGKVYRGQWDPKSGAYPTAPPTNSYWDVSIKDGSASAVFDGKSWKSGDQLIYLEDPKLWDQIKIDFAVTSVQGKTGRVQLIPEDLGLPNYDEMKKEFVGTRLFNSQATGEGVLFAVTLCPIPKPSDSFKRSYISSEITIYRPAPSSVGIVYDSLAIAASSVGNGYKGSLVGDSGDYKLVTFMLDNQEWLGFTSTKPLPPCMVYSKGFSVPNPDFTLNQFTVHSYVKPSTPSSPEQILNSEIFNSIADYTYLDDFYVNGVRVYSPRNLPTTSEIGAFSRAGGEVTGDSNFATKLSVGFNPNISPNLPHLVLSSDMQSTYIRSAGGDGSNNVITFEGEASVPLAKLKIRTKTDSDFTVNGKTISDFIPLVDKVTLGLDKVNNWEATSDLGDASDTKYSTAKAVNTVNKKTEEAKTLAFVYALIL